MFGARAARAALAEPSPPPGAGATAEPPTKPPPLTGASREALWRQAGLERDGAGLEELTRDPHPLVRLIAQCALARTESRGAHRRLDFPNLSPAFDGMHVMIGRDRSATPVRWS